jgi:protein dithiol:quinone oxidoreductase
MSSRMVGGAGLQRSDSARRAQILFAAAIGISLAALAAALVSQHRFDMQPCPWCVLQRLILVLIALAALPGCLMQGWMPGLMQAPGARKASALLVLLLAASGAAAALWQHFVAASSTGCNLTLADRIVGGLGLDALWPAVFAAYASCADAAVNLLGVPYAMWSLATFVLLGAIALGVWLAPSPARGRGLG